MILESERGLASMSWDNIGLFFEVAFKLRGYESYDFFFGLHLMRVMVCFNAAVMKERLFFQGGFCLREGHEVYFVLLHV